ncbi:MAG: TniQ family protein [Desulfuromonadaceae bacterium]|nr:TniQ family protein [Desulfuromonadaceae bacterium]MDD2848492.1 TniQ family protein [Desulfuromonadaceae bacterium]MDD4129879.1 TniQ family protein [Desulfuromonadaceae bacterium]
MITDAAGWPVLEVSRLYNIEPQGLGTPLVECLAGYVVRLAMAHLVSARNLTKYVKSTYQSNTYLIPDNRLIISDKTMSSMNGCNSSAEAWVDALEQLTLRNDLRRLTLLPFSHMFSDKNLVKTFRRWCPSCLDEWLSNGLTLYEPLLWCINMIKICPLHHEPIASSCPHCGHRSLHILPCTQPGFCSHCNGWLGRTTTIKQGIGDNEYQIWAGREIGELLASNSLENSATSESLPTVLDYLIKKRTKRDGILLTSKLINVSPKRLREWLDGERVPELHNLLRLCWLFKLKLVELETLEGCCEKSDGFDERIADASYEISQGRSKIDWMKIEKLLLNIISGEVAPMRVVDIARINDCFPAQIYRRYSDLCKTISKNRTRNSPFWG